MKKLFSVCLAIISVFCFSIPAFATAKTTKEFAKVTKNQQKQSAYGFMEYVGCERGMETIKYGTDENLGKKGDASSFENMLLTLDMLDATNQHRAQEGVSALKVGYALLAEGISHANWSAVTHEHMGSLITAENLAFGNGTPQGASDAWYREKATYLQHPDWWKNGTYEQKQQVGHYANMVNPKYNATGGGLSTKSGYTWAQVFRNTHQKATTKSDSDPLYTVDQVRQKLKEYISHVGYYDENDTSEIAEYPMFDDETPVGTVSGNEWYCMKSDLEMPKDEAGSELKHIYYDNSGNLVLEFCYLNGTNRTMSLEGLRSVTIKSKAENGKILADWEKEIRLDTPLSVPPKSSRDYSIRLSPSQQISRGDLTQGVDYEFAFLI